MKNDNTKSVKRKDKKGRVLRTGETQQADGRYRYSYTVNGKQKSCYSWKLESTDRLPAGKRECVALREQEQEIKRLLNSKVIITSMTVEDLVSSFLEIRDKQVKRRTVALHNRSLNLLKTRQDFCGKKIIDLKIMDMKKFFLSLADDGISYDSIKNLKDIISMAFRMAFEDQLLPVNPMAFNFSALMNKKREKKKPLTDEERDIFLDYVKNDRYHNFYYEAVYILFYTGMRISEFCGLTLKDIDFKERTINIDHQLLVEEDGTEYISSTKSESGVRVLPMTDDVAECFHVLAVRVMRRREQPVVDGHSGFFYLSADRTRPAHGRDWADHFWEMRRRFRKLNPDYHVFHITAHICRHTYCTNMAKAGMPPKALQYLMGHANISTTLDVYAHVNTDDVRAAVNKVIEMTN